MNDRLRELRNTVGMNQEAFGKRLGVKKSAISKCEIGDNNLTEQMVLLVCKEFAVSEHWLRTGEGSMFLPPDERLSSAFAEVVGSEKDTSKKRLILNILEMTDKETDTLEQLLHNLVNRKDS